MEVDQRVLCCTSNTFSSVSFRLFKASSVSINLGAFYFSEIAACAALNRQAGKPVMKWQCHIDMPAAMCNIYAAKLSLKVAPAEVHKHTLLTLASLCNGVQVVW